jgi:hypothetical protein
MRPVAGQSVAQLLDQDRRRLHLGEEPRGEGAQLLGSCGKAGISSNISEAYSMDPGGAAEPRRLSRRLRLPGLLRHPPVDALEQHRKLRRVSDTLPSVACGHTKRPRSSRFTNRQAPWPSRQITSPDRPGIPGTPGDAR